jgi:hypothetical protein
MRPELPNPSLIPFLVAVTGHRDLRPQDLEALRREVRAVFVGMRSRMPSTPLVLLSGLAEGADQLAAEVALKEGVLLVAALPMPVDVYKDQMSEDGQKKFDELLAASAIQIVLPLEGQTVEDVRASEAARANCYEALARFLARYGQSLIALWDGKDSQKRGGTSNVVHYVRSGALDAYVEDAEMRCGVVYQIVTPRLSDPASVQAVKTVELGCEPRQVVGAKRRELGEISAGQRNRFALVEMDFERFNRNAGKGGSTSRARLIDAPGVALSPFEKRLESLYAQADRISLGANGRRKFYLAAILTTALVGTLFYGIHGEMFGDYVWLWFSFPFFVIAALLLHQVARATHVENTYLDTRALAEALRVQLFWTMAGMKEPVDNYYLMDRRAELDWIRIALKNVWLLHEDSVDGAPTGIDMEAVLKNWVTSQETWYRQKADRQSRSVRRREKVSQYGLLFAVLWSISVPVSIMWHGWWHALAPWKALGPEKQFGSDWVYQLLHVALAVPALLAGAYRLWIEQAGYEEQSRDYRSMEREFAIAARELERDSTDTAAAQERLLQLGIEALKENGRWLMLHRERPLEVLSSP